MPLAGSAVDLVLKLVVEAACALVVIYILLRKS